jgi:hypothetical protein
LEDIYKEQARLRQLSKLKNVKDKLPSFSPSLGPNDHNDNGNDDDHKEMKGRVIEVISKSNGLSPRHTSVQKPLLKMLQKR